ncbi:MAG: bifunctional (p)ppGpp synthetase/guanosine-3',5'-bis(diphosphate) 3'-pyrophosphohydrolase [Balneolales bacterium]
MAQIKTHKNFDLEAVELGEEQQAECARLLKLCHTQLDQCDDDLITRAFKLTYISHQGVVRASGEPYYRHPLEVATIVADEIGMDDVSVAAALLHDTVEDTSVELKDIEQEFGPSVTYLIDGLTKISGVFKSKGVKQAETFMKLLLSMAEDLRVVLIKFADRLHNMRTIQHVHRKKQLAVATETIDLYAPLAHRFGLFKIKSELEDLSFKVMDPTGYKFIRRKLREKKEAREIFIEQFMEPIRKQLISGGFQFEIKGRPKHIYSIYRKMMRQQKPFEEIYDLFAIRVILEDPHTKEDCWRVYSFITDSYTPISERFRDFISVPKTNGYQSLHTTVITNTGHKVEVQIRTRKMDEIAEKGLAAHWKYKEGSSEKDRDIERFVHWVREVLENPRPEAATEFVEDFQLNLYTDEIYVFTPNGELRTLPKNATPIDMAFDIHSEIGERALAAKVNGKMVPLRQKLNSGDQVEIITGKQINLNPDWINDVVTHKARSRVKQFIKQKERSVIEKGREIWEKKAAKGNIKISESDLAKVVRQLKFSSILKMFYEIGSDSFDVATLYKAVKNYKGAGRIEDEEDKPIKTVDNDGYYEIYHDDSVKEGERKGLIINGQFTDVKYAYAKCCNPIAGDEVIGFISREGDIKIHRVNCKNTHHLIKTDGERIIEVAWAKQNGRQFIGAVKIIGEDRVGMLNDITNVVSKSLKTNMKSINVSSDSGMFEGVLILMVDDIKHLEKVIKKLQKVAGVKLAYRYE